MPAIILCLAVFISVVQLQGEEIEQEYDPEIERTKQLPTYNDTYRHHGVWVPFR